MVQSIALFYFSGTGNTKKVVGLLAETLRLSDVSVELFSIEDQVKRGITLPRLDAYDTIGIAYPIYGFTTPKIVDSFVATWPEGNGKRVFLLKTGADFFAINHNASAGVIATLEKRGFDVSYDRIIVMPSNWLIKYEDAMIKQLWNSAQKKTAHMSAELLDGTRRRYHPGFFAKAASSGLAFLEKNYGSPSFGSSLRANDMCTLCGLCVRKCPVDNVSITDETVRFGNECISCMRCVYHCPKQAIISKGMNFFALKGGYDIERSLENDEAGEEFVTPHTTGYFKHFLRYFEDVAI